LASIEIQKANKKSKFIVLLSGGFDSPIATYLMMNKGFSCVALSFLTGDDPELKNRQKVIDISKKIMQLTNSTIKLYIGNHNSTLQLFSEVGIRKLTCVMCKRYMLRAARILALKENADFIVNGDILGEQASQTLDNLSQIQKVITDIPVIRPLVGFEKAEVIKLSQKLGIYPLSGMTTPGCIYNPKYPETNAKPKEIAESELHVDYDAIAQKIIDAAEVIQF
jgi:thiamine biosynthesis protein ThiI